MSVSILIPSALRGFVDGRTAVRVEATTAGDALAALVAAHGALGPHLFDETGRLRSFVNVYVGDADIRTLQGTATPVPDGGEMMIVPSIAGGSPAGPLPELSSEEIGRYSRHLILPEVGMEGQRRLKHARVLLVGTGGLGAPLGAVPRGGGRGHARPRRLRRGRRLEPAAPGHPRHEGRRPAEDRLGARPARRHQPERRRIETLRDAR